MAAAEVHQVPPGSIVVLRDVVLDGDAGAMLTTELANMLGHSKFLLLTTVHGGDVEVWGPDDDLTAKVQALLNGDAMTDQPNALTGVPSGADLVKATPDPDEPIVKRRIPVTGTDDEEGQADG